jgi:hypothetical protein
MLWKFSCQYLLGIGQYFALQRGRLQKKAKATNCSTRTRTDYQILFNKILKTIEENGEFAGVLKREYKHCGKTSYK